MRSKKLDCSNAVHFTVAAQHSQLHIEQLLQKLLLLMRDTAAIAATQKILGIVLAISSKRAACVQCDISGSSSGV
jgi:hypothetical protein